MNVYDSFYEAPLDEPPEWEGDDSIPLHSREDERSSRMLFAASPTPTLVVPHRYCEPGTVGDRVYALKRANARFRGGGRLAALMSKPPNVKRTWGKRWPHFFTNDFKETQRRLRVPVTGVYDKTTHLKLAPWYDAAALAELQPDPRDVQIARQMGWLMEFYNTRYSKRYSQHRPSQMGRAQDISYADCSGMVAASCNWARILPRVDWRWTNTDVQISFGEPVNDLSKVLPGDTVLYGHGSDPNHEAAAVGGRRVLSFGSYPAKLLDIDYNRGSLGGRIAIRRFVPVRFS